MVSHDDKPFSKPSLPQLWNPFAATWLRLGPNDKSPASITSAKDKNTSGKLPHDLWGTMKQAKMEMKKTHTGLNWMMSFFYWGLRNRGFIKVKSQKPLISVMSFCALSERFSITENVSRKRLLKYHPLTPHWTLCCTHKSWRQHFEDGFCVISILSLLSHLHKGPSRKQRLWNYSHRKRVPKKKKKSC